MPSFAILQFIRWRLPWKHQIWPIDWRVALASRIGKRCMPLSNRLGLPFRAMRDDAVIYGTSGVLFRIQAHWAFRQLYAFNPRNCTWYYRYYKYMCIRTLYRV